MNRRSFLATVGAVGGTALAGCLLDDTVDSTDQTFTLEDDFEDGIDAWETAAHVGPDADGPFEWDVDVSQTQSRSGEQSVAMFTEGTYDDGTAWIVRPIEIESGRRYHAEAAVYAYSDEESFNELRKLVAYLGPERPESESDFPKSGANDIEDRVGAGLREPLNRVAGWDEYTFEWGSPELETEQLYFAVGVTVVWETDLTYFIDDVDVELETR
ncbi:MAG: twin-arginine translocation signal domain-containing protein [Halobacteriales archaeon]